MAMVINAGTELAAVNTIIGTIGQAPVNSLENSTSADVIMARTLLQEESRSLQDEGWTFNITEGLEVLPDALSSQIPWRPAWLRVMQAGGTSPYVNRQGYLYDRVTRTDLFPSGVSADIIEEVPFDELPHCFKMLITFRAARRFNASAFGDGGTDAEAQQQIARYMGQCNTYELDYGQYSIFTNDSFIPGRLNRN